MNKQCFTVKHLSNQDFRLSLMARNMARGFSLFQILFGRAPVRADTGGVHLGGQRGFPVKRELRQAGDNLGMILRLLVAGVFDAIRFQMVQFDTF